MSEFEKVSNTSSNKIIGIKPIKTKTKNPIENSEEQNKQAEQLFQQAEAAVKEAQVTAENMLASARQTIQLEQEDWQDTKDKLEELAKEQGFQQGLEQGRTAGYQDYSERIEQAAEVIEQAKKDAQSILSESEDVVLHLALTAASKVLHVELVENSRYSELVKHVLKEVKDQKKISIHTHPEDYHILLKQKEELMNIVHFNADLAIYPDMEMERGACIIESPYGRIDAGVESQLQELRDKLFDLAREEDSED